MARLPKAYAKTAPSVNEISNFVGLHRAVHKGDIEAVNRLIRSGANLEARDRSGRTPLFVTGFASHDPTEKLLAEAAADKNAKENRANNIITKAVVANDVEMLNPALEAGASAGNTTSR